MNTTAHDFVTVEMRGLKAALVARAQAERVSVSVLVRGTVARDLGFATDGEARGTDAPTPRAASAGSFRLSIRMSAEEARRLSAGAGAAGLSRGAYLAGLIANVAVLSAGGGRTEHIVTLMASCAELSTLSPNVDRLTALLRQANVEPARPCRAMLNTLAGEGRLEIEGQRAETMRGKDAWRDFVVETRLGGALIPKGAESGHPRKAFNILLSTPRGTDPLTVRWAAREIAKAELADHECVMVLHDHLANPHVHPSVRAEPVRGRLPSMRRADLHRWGETVEAKPRKRGGGSRGHAARDPGCCGSSSGTATSQGQGEV